MMKKTMILMVGLMMGVITSCKTYDGLVLFIEPSATLFTSESVPFKVVFTNASDKTLTIPEPILWRNLGLRVFDEHREHLTDSGTSLDYDDDDGVPIPVKERITLKPYKAWKTESFDLFVQTSPASRLTPNQTVRAVATYTLKDKAFEGDVTLDIPAHDLEIKPEYISGDKALALAIQDLEKRGFSMDTVSNIEPTVQCINGIYRVTYSRIPPPGVRRGPMLISIKVDAITGNILQVAMGR